MLLYMFYDGNRLKVTAIYQHNIVGFTTNIMHACKKSAKREVLHMYDSSFPPSFVPQTCDWQKRGYTQSMTLHVPNHGHTLNKYTYPMENGIV